MMRLGIVSLLAVLTSVLSGSLPTRAESTESAPDLKEVYDLVREHLPDISPAELNRITVQALVSALTPRVSLSGGQSGLGTSEGAPLVPKTGLFDGQIGYIRASRVEAGLDQAVRQAYETLGATNKLNGMVFDLRYAGGTDYAAAVAAAGLFIRKEQPLLDWGKGQVRSKEGADVINLPLAILVNRRSAGAAEALAAVLRETGAGLILGSRTAGQAMIAQEYPLKNGDRLLIANAPIQLGDGSALSAQGVKPDIAVEVSPEDERAYYSDAFKEIGRAGSPTGSTGSNVVAGTNRIRRPRFNEAELVRERRDGIVSDAELHDPGSREAERPVVRDPALARALDFLKGMAVMRQTRF